jgi:nitrosuccinate lyase
VTDPFTDSGLLSPVRAGTRVERAVGDQAWLAALLTVEAGLARAQAAVGTVPAAAAERITLIADTTDIDVREIAVEARETGNPVPSLVAALALAVGDDAAEYLHLGATSQDVIDTATMLVARDALDLLDEDLTATAAALADLARRHRDTPLAGRTLTQHAVPTTFGLKAAGWRALVLDARQRLRGVVLPVSLAGAAGTLAGYLAYAENPADDYADQLVDAFADELSLARPTLPWHTLRTPVADLGTALAFTAGALGKLAADVLSLARTEVGEVAEPAGRGGSSAMPHKRNPALATMLRSAALQVPAFATVLTQALAAEDERPAGTWHAEWLPLRECLRLSGGAAHTARELVDGLVVDAERMRTNLDLTGGLIVAERVTAVLTTLLGRPTAKSLVGKASADAAASGRPLAEVLAAEPELVNFPQDELRRLCDPATYTGAAASLVDRALGEDTP